MTFCSQTAISKEGNGMTLIDLFSGAGGLSEGFRQAGFSIIAANDFDHWATETFRHNHTDTNVIEAPIQEVQPEDLLSVSGLPPGQIDVLVGGPPCQAFSVYNHQRGFHDERSGLFREYIRMVKGLNPKVIVMENVTGMASVESGRAIKEIHEELGSLGYLVENQVLKAEEFGVPQERRRMIFIGTRVGSHIEWPRPTHFGASVQDLFADDRLTHVTVWDAISDLPPLEINEGNEETDYPGPPVSNYQIDLRSESSRLFNHVAPHLGDINLKRLAYIPEGGSWRDIPHELLPAGMKRAKRSDHTKRYGRLSRSGLCCTVLTKCDLHWGSYIHPTQERTLTVREAARFQSFPDHVRFLGSRGEQYKQVGNAVPPLLGKAVAMSVAAMLHGCRAEVAKAI